MSITRILSPAVPEQPGPGQHAVISPQRGARAQPPASRATWVEVDLDAIAANVTALKAQAAAPRLMAVVKADGYGHGLVPAARAVLAGGADWLAVALVEEGEALRAAGVEAPILVLVEPAPVAIPRLLEQRLTPAVYTSAFIEALDVAARRADAGPVGVHLKLDTGMRRVGVPQADWEAAISQVGTAEGLRFEALWSHFAVADEPGHEFIAHQAAEMRRGIDMAERLGHRPELVHLANSAGTLHLHDDHHDMVRPGLAVYGLEPAPGLGGGLLTPALSWWSRLGLVKALSAGEAVSYGLRWTAERDTIVGTVPAGYADGVVRSLGHRGAQAVVGGRRVPYAGTVCMDQFLLDLGPEGAQAGDEVCLIGQQGDEQVGADDWAAWIGTINYEVVCGIGRRVPRVYVGEAGQEVT